MFHSFFKKKDKNFTMPITTQAKPSAKSIDQVAQPEEKLTDGVWLKYKEGFINAVRYNIKISELL